MTRATRGEEKMRVGADMNGIAVAVSCCLLGRQNACGSKLNLLTMCLR